MRIIPNGGVDVGLKSIWVDVRHLGLAVWDWFLRTTVGYGLYPFKSVIALFPLFALATIPAHYAWEEGSKVPNSGPVLVSSGWLEVANFSIPAQAWSLTDSGRDWDTFNRYAWAADLVIPIIDLGQTAAWAPSTERGPWGANLWWARWLLIIAGWIVTALGAAAITGIIRRE
ncbi:MAG: hypothetical protein JKY94_06225 [Rhodobacteraceae bacterium]|nr:hypothetical protein [Paracoccaceae bacterium]